jgi:imidazolonepropionase-like amidohydrolase
VNTLQTKQLQRSRFLLPPAAVFAGVILMAFAGLTRVSAQPAATPVTAIVGATVIDGTGAQPTQRTVVIRGDRIETVADKVELPAGAKVIHAEGKTLLPGLFDLHTHLNYSTTSVSPDWPKNLKAYLYCGVTSVADFGSSPEMFEPMRKLIANGTAIAPHIAIAVRVVTPGGHGDEGGRGDFFSLEVQTPRDARAAIRKVLPYHPDVIKAFTDGWRYGAAADLNSMNEETLTALVDEAHKNGLKVLTHTVTLRGDKIAARAGVDVIDHGIGDADADPEVIALLKQHGTTYASTLAVYEQKPRGLPVPWVSNILDPAVLRSVTPQTPRNAGAAARPAEQADNSAAATREARWKHLLHNVKTLSDAGIPIGDGTDAGETVTFHGYATLREMELLVDAGLTPIQAIQSATLVSAKALGVDKDRGSIAPGKLADLVLVDGSPQTEIKDIEKTARVWFAGREIDREQLSREITSPEMSPVPALRVAELLDDVEGPADPMGPEFLRSRIGTLWVNSTDSGTDHSRMIFGRTTRAPGDHAINLEGWMSVAERPWIAVTLPLGKGGIEPVDVSGYSGVSFDVRGEGDYRLVVPTRAIRNNNFFQATFPGTAEWKTIRIPLSTLKPSAEGRQAAGGSPAWTGTDALGLVFRIERKPGEFGWLELDNVRFYK